MLFAECQRQFELMILELGDKLQGDASSVAEIFLDAANTYTSKLKARNIEVDGCMSGIFKRKLNTKLLVIDLCKSTIPNVLDKDKAAEVLNNIT